MQSSRTDLNVIVGESMVTKSRTMSSRATAASAPSAAESDDSPKCVTWNFGAMAAGSGGGGDGQPMGGIDTGDSPIAGRGLAHSFTMTGADAESQHSCENHEVELKDFEGLYDGDEESEEEESPSSPSGRSMKKLMSRVKMNPKLKNFISGMVAEKNVKVVESDCEQSVEISLEKEQSDEERTLTTKGSVTNDSSVDTSPGVRGGSVVKVATTKEDGSCDTELVVQNQSPLFCPIWETEEEGDSYAVVDYNSGADRDVPIVAKSSDAGDKDADCQSEANSSRFDEAVEVPLDPPKIERKGIQNFMPRIKKSSKLMNFRSSRATENDDEAIKSDSCHSVAISLQEEQNEDEKSLITKESATNDNSAIVSPCSVIRLTETKEMGSHDEELMVENTTTPSCATCGFSEENESNSGAAAAEGANANADVHCLSKASSSRSDEALEMPIDPSNIEKKRSIKLLMTSVKLNPLKNFVPSRALDEGFQEESVQNEEVSLQKEQNDEETSLVTTDSATNGGSVHVRFSIKPATTKEDASCDKELVPENATHPHSTARDSAEESESNPVAGQGEGAHVDADADCLLNGDSSRYEAMGAPLEPAKGGRKGSLKKLMTSVKLNSKLKGFIPVGTTEEGVGADSLQKEEILFQTEQKDEEKGLATTDSAKQFADPGEAADQDDDNVDAHHLLKATSSRSDEAAETQLDLPNIGRKGGIKKLISSVKLNPKLRNFIPAASIEEGVEADSGKGGEALLQSELEDEEKSLATKESKSDGVRPSVISGAVVKLATTKEDGSYDEELVVDNEKPSSGGNAEDGESNVGAASDGGADTEVDAGEDAEAKNVGADCPLNGNSSRSDEALGVPLDSLNIERKGSIMKLMTSVKLNSKPFSTTLPKALPKSLPPLPKAMPKLGNFISSSKLSEPSPYESVELSLHGSSHGDTQVGDLSSEIICEVDEAASLHDRLARLVISSDESCSKKSVEILEDEVLLHPEAKESLQGTLKQDDSKGSSNEEADFAYNALQGIQENTEDSEGDKGKAQCVKATAVLSDMEEMEVIPSLKINWSSSKGGESRRSISKKNDEWENSVKGRVGKGDISRAASGQGSSKGSITKGVDVDAGSRSNTEMEAIPSLKINWSSSRGGESRGSISKKNDELESSVKGRTGKGNLSRTASGEDSSKGSITKGVNDEGSRSNAKRDHRDLPTKESQSFKEVVDAPDKPFEFQQMKVTLKFKVLAGLSQVTSRKKTSSTNDEGFDDTIKAVVTYRRNTIASDRFVSTHVPSLPVFFESTPDPTNKQVYAQWPGGHKKDDASESSTFLMSSVSLIRTVRRVRNMDNLSCRNTAGGTPIKELEEQDGKAFLASLSKAFAPELLDLQVGLMRGSSEIIPLGIATVVIPGETKRMELDIPVVRNHYTNSGDHALSKKSVSQFLGMTKHIKDHVYFSSDKETEFKVNEGAFLRLEMKIEPAITAASTALPSFHQNAYARRADFRSGPINQALRRRRKMDHLLSLKKLPLHQRIQLYLELRSRRGGNVNKKETPNSKDVFITRQSEVSEVSCEIPPSNAPSQTDDASASLVMDQFDMNALTWKDEDEDADASAGSVSVSTADMSTKVERMSLASQGSGASAKSSTKEKEAPASSFSVASVDTSQKSSIKEVSVSSFLEKEQGGRLSPSSQDSEHEGGPTQFSSSLHSVFTTNHPQRTTVARDLLDLLTCDTNFFLCELERKALRYYAEAQEERLSRSLRRYAKKQDEKISECCYFDAEEFSIQETIDEETLASLESLSVNLNRTT